MNTVTLSPEFQVVIPQAVREELRIKPGDKFRVIGHADRLELIPDKSIQSVRGVFKGMGTDVEREEDRL
jgi:AbrB family looped-hinge helix DNA binding protein